MYTQETEQTVKCQNKSIDSWDFTCGSPLSPAACNFSFIRATFAAVALFFAPLRPLLLDPSFDSEQPPGTKENKIQVNRSKGTGTQEWRQLFNTDPMWTKEEWQKKLRTTLTNLQSSAPALWWLAFEAFGLPASHTCDYLDVGGYKDKTVSLLVLN